MNFTLVETFSTSHTFQLWRNFQFLRICHMDKFELSPHVEKHQISPHLSCGEILNYSTCGEIFRFLRICHAYKFEISPHDKFFSTYLTCDTCDKYQVCPLYPSCSSLVHTCVTGAVMESGGGGGRVQLPSSAQWPQTSH